MTTLQDIVRSWGKLQESPRERWVRNTTEFEKLVSGLESSGKSDSGVTSRIVGTILTWAQETKAPVYKVATSNSIRGLDSALFRRGRWDEVFAVGLPTLEERKMIYSIHLLKRKRDPEKFDLETLARESDGFVGAEIEAAVTSALFQAFSERREMVTEDVLAVTKTIVPISRTAAEEIEAFSLWMKNRAVSVSSSHSSVIAGVHEGGKRRSLRKTAS